MPNRDAVTDDPRTWPAGRRLDAVVAAELVAMRYSERLARRSRWSSDARAVETLIDETTSTLFAGRWAFTLTCSPERWPKWQCGIVGDSWEAEGVGETLPLAFCRALLHKQEEATDAHA